MKKSVCMLACLIALSSITTPAQAITYNTYKGIIGGGALAAALIGAAIYKKQHDEKQSGKDYKKRDRVSIGKTIGAAAIGAVATGISLALFFYKFTPGCRFDQAEEILFNARNNNLLQPAVNLDPANVTNAANRAYRRYPLVYAEEGMTKVATDLEIAQALYRQAQMDADGDQAFVARCNQSNQAAGQLNQDAQDKAAVLRGLDLYHTQVANQSKEKLTLRRIAIEERKTAASERKAYAAVANTQIKVNKEWAKEQKAKETK